MTNLPEKIQPNPDNSITLTNATLNSLIDYLKEREKVHYPDLHTDGNCVCGGLIPTGIHSKDRCRDNSYTPETPQDKWQPVSCGCTIETPHSHLVVGQSCACEKGNPLTNLKDQ